MFTLAGGVWATGALLSNPDVPAWTSSLIALPVALLCWTAFQQLRLVSRMPTARRSSEQTAESSRRGRRIGTWFGVIFVVEGLTIAGVASLLARADLPLLIPVAIVAIFGLHLVPLGRLFAMPIYVGTGILLAAMAATSLWWQDDRTRVFLLSLAVATVLWIGAGRILTVYVAPKFKPH